MWRLALGARERAEAGERIEQCVSHDPVERALKALEERFAGLAMADEYARVSEASKRLNMLGVRLSLPVIALASCGRAGNAKGKPQRRLGSSETPAQPSRVGGRGNDGAPTPTGSFFRLWQALPTHQGFYPPELYKKGVIRFLRGRARDTRTVIDSMKNRGLRAVSTRFIYGAGDKFAIPAGSG